MKSLADSGWVNRPVDRTLCQPSMAQLRIPDSSFLSRLLRLGSRIPTKPGNLIQSIRRFSAPDASERLMTSLETTTILVLSFWVTGFIFFRSIRRSSSPVMDRSVPTTPFESRLYPCLASGKIMSDFPRATDSAKLLPIRSKSIEQ